MLNNLKIELEKDLEIFLNFAFNKFFWYKNLKLWKKFILIILILSTVLIFYYFIILSYFSIKYIFKYLFIIIDNLIYKINKFKYQDQVYLFYYITWYIWIKIIYIYSFYYFSIIINYLKEQITNYFFIKFWFIKYITKLKLGLDKKLYNIYLKLEYIFGFSYIIEWIKLLEGRKYKYLKYFKLYASIFMEKTFYIRKKLYIYYLYTLNIIRTIFWLYIFKIYLNLFFSSMFCTFYFIFIITPQNIFIYIKYWFIYKSTIFNINRREWIHVRDIFYKFFFFFNNIFWFNFNYYLLSLNFFFVFVYSKYLFEYILSWFIYSMKLFFFDWKYFVYLTDYKGSRLFMDLIFQYETLFLFIFLHCEWDINLNVYFFRNAIKGHFKYFYFIMTQYKFFNYLRKINFISSIKFFQS